jgi:hypothetical protein
MRGKYRPFAEDSKGILKNLGGIKGVGALTFQKLLQKLDLFCPYSNYSYYWTIFDQYDDIN